MTVDQELKQVVQENLDDSSEINKARGRNYWERTSCTTRGTARRTHIQERSSTTIWRMIRTPFKRPKNKAATRIVPLSAFNDHRTQWTGAAQSQLEVPWASLVRTSVDLGWRSSIQHAASRNCSFEALKSISMRKPFGEALWNSYGMKKSIPKLVNREQS